MAGLVGGRHEGVVLQEVVKENECVYPYTVSAKGDDSLILFIAAECILITECNFVMEALYELISVYLAFNIAYPKPLYPVFIFFYIMCYSLNIVSVYLIQ